MVCGSEQQPAPAMSGAQNSIAENWQPGGETDHKAAQLIEVSMRRYNPTRRGNIPLDRCLCGWSRKKKKIVTNGCPIHKRTLRLKAAQ